MVCTLHCTQPQNLFREQNYSLLWLVPSPYKISLCGCLSLIRLFENMWSSYIFSVPLMENISGWKLNWRKGKMDSRNNIGWRLREHLKHLGMTWTSWLASGHVTCSLCEYEHVPWTLHGSLLSPPKKQIVLHRDVVRLWYLGFVKLWEHLVWATYRITTINIGCIQVILYKYHLLWSMVTVRNWHEMTERDVCCDCINTNLGIGEF